MVLRRTASGRFERATRLETRFVTNVKAEATLQVRAAYLAFQKTVEAERSELVPVLPMLASERAEVCSVGYLELEHHGFGGLTTR